MVGEVKNKFLDAWQNIMRHKIKKQIKNHDSLRYGNAFVETFWPFDFPGTVKPVLTTTSE